MLNFVIHVASLTRLKPRSHVHSLVYGSLPFAFYLHVSSMDSWTCSTVGNLHVSLRLLMLCCASLSFTNIHVYTQLHVLPPRWFIEILTLRKITKTATLTNRHKCTCTHVHLCRQTTKVGTPLWKLLKTNLFLKHVNSSAWQTILVNTLMMCAPICLSPKEWTTAA